MSLLRIPTAFCAAFATIIVGAALPAAAHDSATSPSFTFTSVNFPNAANTYVWGFAPDGGLVGAFYDAAGHLHGYFQNKAGAFKQFDLTSVKGGTTGTQIIAQNDTGLLVQVAGGGSTGGDASYFVNNAGKYTQIAIPNATSTWAFGMNASGTIVGSYQSADGIIEAFTYKNGKYTTFRQPGMDDTEYNGINDKGDIVGFYQYQGGPYLGVGFILSAGKMKVVQYPDVTVTILQAINNAGEAVGYVRDEFDRSNTGFIYKSGVFTDVRVGSTGYEWIFAINSKGDIVGADIPEYTAASGFIGIVH